MTDVITPRRDRIAKEIITIHVFEFLGGPLYVPVIYGDRLHDKIAYILKGDKRFALSFEHIEVIISASLSVPIGPLYGEFKKEVVDDHLLCLGLSSEDIGLVNRVRKNAVLYFENVDKCEREWVA